MDVKERVFQIVATELAICLDTIKLDSKFIDLAADSFDLVNLIITLEDAFNIDFSDEELDIVCTVKDAIELIEKKIGTDFI
jgi:acyl carrier protein